MIRDSEIWFKLVIFGDGGVGKTSMCHRYLHRMFKPDLKLTIGVDFGMKKLEIGDKKIILHIWDFGGEERFQILFPNYANGASGGIFMYDIARASSLSTTEKWMKLFRESTGNKIPIIMTGGKLDLQEKRTIKTEDAKKILNQYNFNGYIECSSKTGENVEGVFKKIAIEMLKSIGLSELASKI